VKNRRSKEFLKQFAHLPPAIKIQAKESYCRFKADPYHSSLHFKCIDPQDNIYSVRVGLHYRAAGIRQGNTIIWFFIGSHEDYNHLIG
jgi:hypothetical protein